MMLTEEEFRLFRNLIYEESGIYLKESKKDFLEHRVARRMNETKIPSPYRYYKLVTQAGTAELDTLLDLMTVNETSFFRNRPQLDLFGSIILPDVMERNVRKGRKRLRIWSAGCSTGEEPYTVAMIVREALAGKGEWDVKIHASDLSLSVLQTAKRAAYALDKVQATVDDYYLARYFTRNGTTATVRDEVRGMVEFDYHNLKNDNGISGLDVIFCRNVMIYFDTEEQKRLVGKFSRSLEPGGYLVVGHAESLQSWNTGFRFLYHQGGTAYQKQETGEL